jgi:SnoaL-like domain
MKQREDIIINYIDAYNSFDVDKMLTDFDPSIKFENISNGTISMTLTGLSEFRKQAEQAKSLFSKRQQTIKSYKHEGEQTEIEIDYQATLAIDLPNGLKQGDELNLVGRSIFQFFNDKIIALTDIS